MNEILSHLALVVCLLGLAIWMVVIRLQPESQPKDVARVGEYMFWVGLLAFLLGK